jgi:hypothetical protein
MRHFFQSSPNLKVGCNIIFFLVVEHTESVSILTRPESRVQSAMGVPQLFANSEHQAAPLRHSVI